MGLLSPYSGQMFSEALQGAAPTLAMPVARVDRFEFNLMQGKSRFRAKLRENHCQQRFGPRRFAGRISPRKSANDPLGLHDLVIDALQPVIGSVARAHVKVVGASRTQIDVARG